MDTSSHLSDNNERGRRTRNKRGGSNSSNGEEKSSSHIVGSSSGAGAADDDSSLSSLSSSSTSSHGSSVNPERTRYSPSLTEDKLDSDEKAKKGLTNTSKPESDSTKQVHIKDEPTTVGPSAEPASTKNIKEETKAPSSGSSLSSTYSSASFDALSKVIDIEEEDEEESKRDSEDKNSSNNSSNKAKPSAYRRTPVVPDDDDDLDDLDDLDDDDLFDDVDADNEDNDHEDEDEDEEDDDQPSEITRCICGHQDLQLNNVHARDQVDVSLFIQCDKCQVWQHGYCVGIKTNEDAPQVYYCERCRPDYHLIVVRPNGKTSNYSPQEDSEEDDKPEKVDKPLEEEVEGGEVGEVEDNHDIETKKENRRERAKSKKETEDREKSDDSSLLSRREQIEKDLEANTKVEGRRRAAKPLYSIPSRRDPSTEGASPKDDDDLKRSLDKSKKKRSSSEKPSGKESKREGRTASPVLKESQPPPAGTGKRHSTRSSPQSPNSANDKSGRLTRTRPTLNSQAYEENLRRAIEESAKDAEAQATKGDDDEDEPIFHGDERQPNNKESDYEPKSSKHQKSKEVTTGSKAEDPRPDDVKTVAPLPSISTTTLNGSILPHDFSSLASVDDDSGTPSTPITATSSTLGRTSRRTPHSKTATESRKRTVDTAGLNDEDGATDSGRGGNSSSRSKKVASGSGARNSGSAAHGDTEKEDTGSGLTSKVTGSLNKRKRTRPRSSKDKDEQDTLSGAYNGLGKSDNTGDKFDRPSKPRIPPARTTIPEMQKRIAALGEYIVRGRYELDVETDSRQQLMEFREQQFRKLYGVYVDGLNPANAGRLRNFVRDADGDIRMEEDGPPAAAPAMTAAILGNNTEESNPYPSAPPPLSHVLLESVTAANGNGDETSTPNSLRNTPEPPASSNPSGASSSRNARSKRTTSKQQKQDREAREREARDKEQKAAQEAEEKIARDRTARAMKERQELNQRFAAKSQREIKKELEQKLADPKFDDLFNGLDNAKSQMEKIREMLSHWEQRFGSFSKTGIE